MHTDAYAYVARTVAAYPPHHGARVVEIGARDINGSVRPLFPWGQCHYLGTDVADGPGVDLVADGATLTLSEHVHIVVCCEVLEHAANADAILANAARLLAPGGRVILTMAGQGEGWARTPHSAVDGGGLRSGEHYANVSAPMLTDWLTSAGFVDVLVEEAPGPRDLYATARMPT